MTFLMVLFALVIERFFHWGHLRHWRWFKGYQQWLASRIGSWSPFLIFLICVLPPVLIVGLISFLLTGWLYGIYKFIFGLLILLYCLGPKNFWLQAYACISSMQGDVKTAMQQAQTDFNVVVPENPQTFHHSFTKAIFHAAYQRIFAVLFWFIVLGPMGAVLYRLTFMNKQSTTLGISNFSQKVLEYLDWIPVRVFTFLFALSGHFTPVFMIWKKWAGKGIEANDVMLMECGTAALDITEAEKIQEDGSAEKDAIAMLDRSFIILLVILALLVMAV